jgi:hypothetical protein
MINISYSGYRFPPEIIQHAICVNGGDKGAGIANVEIARNYLGANHSLVLSVFSFKL